MTGRFPPGGKCLRLDRLTVTLGAALALLASPGSATAQQGAAASGAGSIETHRLANGLEILVVPRSAIPFATVQMVVRGGAFLQTQSNLLGLPHLLEHMLFRQSDRAFESNIGKRISDMDASWNGVTSEEAVRYYFHVPSKHTAEAIAVMAEMMRRGSFDQADLTVEKQVVRGELERRAAEPELLLLTTADRQLWSDAGWERKNPGGNVLSINDASVQRIEELHRRFYVPNNTALVVTGDVKPAEVFAEAERRFGDWKPGAEPFADVPPLEIPPLTVISRETVTAPVGDVTVLVRWHGPSAGTDRAATYAADVFSGVVNQPLSGTRRRLVDTGLFESVGFSYATRRHVGQLELYAKVSPQRLAPAISALGREIQQLAKPDYFTEEDLALAKRQQVVVREMQAESASSYAHAVSEFWASVDTEYIRTYFDSLATRSAADLHEFQRTYLVGKHMTVTLLLSPETQRQLGVRVRNSLNTWKVP